MVARDAQATYSAVQELPAWAIRLLTAVRSGFLYLIEPLDYLGRFINGKKDLPPLGLRRYAGPLSSLESSGAEFLAYLKLLCRISPHTRILDIGCGFGLMALYLKDYLKPPGSYTGMDINRRAIKWAQKAIARKHPNFYFLHLDVRNTAYNPLGKFAAEEVPFPFHDGSFGCILFRSVFTYMRSAEVQNYLAEVARLLAPQGVCLAIFFLLNETQEELHAKGLNAIDFRFGDGLWRYAWREMPELAVAFSEKELHKMLDEAGLEVKRICYGTWSGREEGLSYQDMVIVRKKE